MIDDTSSIHIYRELVERTSDISSLRIEFKSDRIINKGIGFEAVFSLGELLIYQRQGSNLRFLTIC